jgi:hypothetical protein
MWFGGYVVRNSETGAWEEQFSINDDEARSLVAYLHSLK